MTREPVDFMTIETGDDLIVSFAISGEGPGEVLSLILLRTPKYEFLLDEGDRGVSVSYEEDEEDLDARLTRIRFVPPHVEIESTHARYALDVSRVDDEDLKFARRVLKEMNFDNRFALEVG